MMTHTEAHIDQIIIGNRARQDFGDIDALVESIKNVGLLQPILVTVESGELWLVDGHRRIQAFQKLGRKIIPAVYLSQYGDAPFESLSLQAEYDANIVRKQFTPSEAVHLADKIRIFYENRAKLRQHNAQIKDDGANLAQDPDKGKKTRDLVANAVGLSHQTLKKATEIVRAAEADPKNADLVKRMDKTGKVDPVHKELRIRENVPPGKTIISKEILEISKDTKSTIKTLIVEMPDGRQKKMGSISSNWYQNKNVLCWIIENVGLGTEEKDIVIHREGNKVSVFDSDNPEPLKGAIRYLVDRYSFTGSLMDAFEGNEQKAQEDL